MVRMPITHDRVGVHTALHQRERAGLALEADRLSPWRAIVPHAMPSDREGALRKAGTARHGATPARCLARPLRCESLKATWVSHLTVNPVSWSPGCAVRAPEHVVESRRAAVPACRSGAEPHAPHARRAQAGLAPEPEPQAITWAPAVRQPGNPPLRRRRVVCRAGRPSPGPARA